jgi:hypothetical protein
MSKADPELCLDVTELAEAVGEAFAAGARHSITRCRLTTIGVNTP